MTSHLPGPHPVDIVRRVRAWNVSSWRHGNRVVHVRAALARLAVLANSHDSRSRPVVPDAGVHALADQLEVLMGDALGAGASGEEVDFVLRELAVDLGLR